MSKILVFPNTTNLTDDQSDTVKALFDMPFISEPLEIVSRILLEIVTFTRGINASALLVSFFAIVESPEKFDEWAEILTQRNSKLESLNDSQVKEIIFRWIRSMQEHLDSSILEGEIQTAIMGELDDSNCREMAQRILVLFVQSET